MNTGFRLQGACFFLWLIRRRVLLIFEVMPTICSTLLSGTISRNIQVFANEIVSQLRSEILDVRSALEKVGRTEHIDNYIMKFGQYRRVINENHRHCPKRQNTNWKAPIYWRLLKALTRKLALKNCARNVNRVRQVLVIFSRLISELVSTGLQARRNATSPPQFLHAAIHFVKIPLQQHQEDFILKQWGAITLEDTISFRLRRLGHNQGQARVGKKRALFLKTSRLKPYHA